MKVRYTFRCYPTLPQQRVLAKTFGCVRVAYNSALKLRTDSFKAGKALNYFDSFAALTKQKKTPEYAFLSQVSSIPLQQSLRHLQTAYSNFFAKRAKYPTFKRKGGAESAEYTSSGFKYEPNHLVIVKIGYLKVRWSRAFKSTPTTVTVVKRANGQYYVTLCLDESFKALPKTGAEVGIDLGVNRLATYSNGERIPNPRYLAKKLARLKRYQRVLARRKPGSKRRELQRIKVAKLHSYVSNSRKDHLDKVTTDLVKRFDVIAIEDLNVHGMVQNHCLAAAISDVGMHMFRSMLEYKCAGYGKQLRLCDRFFPSSKRCNVCGYTVAKLPLNIRNWVCPECHTAHDRDLNASLNILAAGQAVNAQGEDVRLLRGKPRKSGPRRAVNQPALTGT